MSLIPANPSIFCGIFLHLDHVFRIPHSSQNITESQIIQGKYRFPPNGCQVSHSGHVIAVDDLWAVMLYTIANGACPSGTERKRLRQEMDR